MRSLLRPTGWRHRLSCLGAAAVTATAVAAAEPAKITLGRVRVENAVSNCMTLEPKEVQQSGSIEKLVADAQFITSTGECGCKSALLRYRVYAQGAHGQRMERLSGTVNTMGNVGAKAIEFVLSPEPPTRRRNALIVSISCATSP